MWWRTFNCSPLLIYRPREDERLSWPDWLTSSGRLTHISGHPSATGRAQDGERTLARDWRSTAEPRGIRQRTTDKLKAKKWKYSKIYYIWQSTLNHWCTILAATYRDYVPELNWYIYTSFISPNQAKTCNKNRNKKCITRWQSYL